MYRILEGEARRVSAATAGASAYTKPNCWPPPNQLWSWISRNCSAGEVDLLYLYVIPMSSAAIGGLRWPTVKVRTAKRLIAIHAANRDEPGKLTIMRTGFSMTPNPSPF